MTTTQIEALGKRATEVHNHARRLADDIRRDPNLTAAGKEAALQEVRDSSNAEIDQLKQQRDSIRADALKADRKLAVGHGAEVDALTKRDAAARAGQLSDAAEASELLATAERLDDEVLAKEVVNAALEQGWASVIREYGNAHPELEAALTRLFHDRHPRELMGVAITNNLIGSMAFARVSI